MNSKDDKPHQTYFSGHINPPFPDKHTSEAFGKNLVARFDAAIPGLDNLLIAWWDGSCSNTDGGYATVVDICLPAHPKISIVIAEPVKTFEQNTTLVEMQGALNVCLVIQRIMAYCKTEKLLEGIVGKLEIILITNCQAVLHTLQGPRPSTKKSSKCLKPILDRIKDISTNLLSFDSAIKLDLYHCHKNTVPNMWRAGTLARIARGNKSTFQSVIYNDEVGDIRAGDEIYYKVWQPQLYISSYQRILEMELRAALHENPTKRRQLKISRIHQKQGNRTRRRKMNGGQFVKGEEAGGRVVKEEEE